MLVALIYSAPPSVAAPTQMPNEVGDLEYLFAEPPTGIHDLDTHIHNEIYSSLDDYDWHDNCHDNHHGHDDWYDHDHHDVSDDNYGYDNLHHDLDFHS